ncbi:MAG: hypothetical protein IJ218_05630 [Alphaproteobacteria bacterium]|nr:hypothetical protein [Alphaproteobacteria bacterium]
MSRNKSSYAEKHLPHIADETGVFAEFMKKDKDLLETMRSPYDFETKFLKLPYQRQIAMIDMFRNITTGKLVISPRQIKQTLLDLTYEELEHLHWLTGSYYEEGNAYFPIADDEKKLVRMECYGTIDARREHELSPYYKFFKKPENRGKFRLKDYDLLQSPMWKVFNQFESFRSIAPKVRRYLYEQGFNPDALKVMSVNDYCDVIHSIYAKSPDSMKARFLPFGYKNKFVMNFMKHCGKELEQHLLKRGLDKRKVVSLCRMMTQYGICDVDHVTITETHYTERILADLKAHNYDVSKYKVGDKIAEDFLDKVFANNQENLLLARDEKGLTLSKDDMPRYEVHHKNAVKFAHSGDYLAKVNYNNNLMLVEKEIHRAYYHGFDHIIQVNDNNEKYFSRLNSTIPEMCMIDGFNPDTDMFFYNLEKNTSSKRRAINDKKNVVNYYDMQFERLNNIPQIAEKYGIEYSKIDLNNEYKGLQELTQFKVNISKKDLKVFEEFFTTNKSVKNTKKNKNIPQIKNTGNER